jgi:hypothetical protein
MKLVHVAAVAAASRLLAAMLLPAVVDTAYAPLMEAAITGN